MDDPLFSRTAVGADQIQLIDLDPPQPDPQAIIDRLLAGEAVSIVADALFASVVTLLTRRRDECLNAQDSNAAEKCDDILLALRQMRVDSVREAVFNNREATMGRRLEAARLRAIDLEDRYRYAVDRVVEENSDHVAKLNGRHQEEREAFEASWQTPQRTRLFSRASPALINLRRQNYMLLQARRYEDQRAAERQLDEMERTEIQEQSRNMMIDYESQAKLLEEKQQQEMGALLIANEGRLSLLKRAQEKEVSAARQRVANLESEMKNAKESRAFATGYGKLRQNEVPPSRAQARTAPMNMAQICTLRLPPLPTGHGRRPFVYSSMSLGKRK
jgi:hypothetical protein